MTETIEEVKADAGSPTVSSKKVKNVIPKGKKVKSVSKKANHPPTSQMVTTAIKDLKERGGSSLQAIKKYLTTTYNVDAEKMSIYIRKFIKSAVESGDLVQTKGKGAAGSFRLGGSSDPAGGVKKSVVKSKKQTLRTPAKTSPKKEATPLKAKKTKKPPTTPKAPKPKTTTTPAKAKRAVTTSSTVGKVRKLTTVAPKPEKRMVSRKASGRKK